MQVRVLVHRFLVAALGLLAAGCAPNTRPMDLRLIERSDAPNDALACPRATCRAAADFESPVFPIDRKELMAKAIAVFSDQPRTEFVTQAPALDQAVFVQRSRIFGFPDTIWIQTVGIDARASVIVYSRSNYGYWDLGVNRGRVGGWLEALRTAKSRNRGN